MKEKEEQGYAFLYYDTISGDGYAGPGYQHYRQGYE